MGRERTSTDTEPTGSSWPIAGVTLSENICLVTGVATAAKSPAQHAQKYAENSVGIVYYTKIIR